MVRIAIVALALTRTVADEDVYHHTQLLQTKVSPQKVAVDADGVKDDVALFQSSLHKKTFQSSKKAAQQKFVALLRRKKLVAGKPGGKGDSSYGGWSSYDSSYGGWSSYGSSYDDYSDKDAENDCKVYYGDACDVDKFKGCGEQEFDTESSSWYPDPNVGVKNIAGQMDDCMGATNLLTSKCTAAYGPEVGLFDCMMCGMICECPSPEECDADCHMECMANDEENWAGESSYATWGETYGTYGDETDHEADGECKLFYGDDVDVEKCEGCGETCWDEAMKGVEGYGEERDFYEALGSCMDKCMGQTNLVTQACRKHYGPDVDVFECTSCGMVCNCDLEGCEGSTDYFACHPTCMEEDWMVGGDSSYSNWSSYSSYLEVKTNMKNRAKAKAKAVKASKNLAGDATDLMQTSKHLKK